MSGWTVATLRAREGRNYEYSRYDSTDPVDAMRDLCATAEADDGVRTWTMDSPHIYLYCNCDRYNWGFAEKIIENYQEMVRDAVVLGANDTTDTGTARYYEVTSGDIRCTDEYKETQSEDGTFVGQYALSVINSRHSILARDPFHGWVGRLDDRYAEEGYNRL